MSVFRFNLSRKIKTYKRNILYFMLLYIPETNTSGDTGSSGVIEIVF